MEALNLKNLVIYGAGGFGREVAWLVERINNNHHEWRVLGFIDDVKTEMYGKSINGLTVLGGREWFAENQKEVYVTCPVGSSRGRRFMYQFLAQYPNVKLATIVDPSAMIGKASIIEDGVIIGVGARITVNSRIRRGVVVNHGSAVGHDSELTEFCTLFVNVMVSGTVKLGENSELGSGSFIREYLSVCSDVVIAPLSAVLRDITEPGLYAGNPARRMK